MSVLRPEDFDFALPPESIAQQPAAERGSSRMLLLGRNSGSYSDRHFRDLPDYLRAGDVLVMNDTRVIPARLFGHRVLQDGSDGEGRVEALLLEQHSAEEWSALMRPGRALRAGQRVRFAGGGATLDAEVTAHGERGERRLRFAEPEQFWPRLEALGHMPLPPYIRREDAVTDRERYQTVVARERGSAAAPTAGLHFTPEMLTGLREGGVEIHTVTLHVGLGTFQPLTPEAIASGRLHEERYTLPATTADAVNAARQEGRRVAAVGTTVVRTLEHCALAGGALEPHSGRTSIFIRPGFAFRVVGAMLTNFHLPQSSLLMLVSAFAGKEPTLAAYRHAVVAGYRFVSYGDCMFIT